MGISCSGACRVWWGSAFVAGELALVRGTATDVGCGFRCCSSGGYLRRLDASADAERCNGGGNRYCLFCQCGVSACLWFGGTQSFIELEWPGGDIVIVDEC